jgi:hypothetical protein
LNGLKNDCLAVLDYPAAASIQQGEVREVYGQNENAAGHKDQVQSKALRCSQFVVTLESLVVHLGVGMALVHGCLCAMVVEHSIAAVVEAGRVEALERAIVAQ